MGRKEHGLQWGLGPRVNHHEGAVSPDDDADGSLLRIDEVDAMHGRNRRRLLFRRGKPGTREGARLAKCGHTASYSSEMSLLV